MSSSCIVPLPQLHMPFVLSVVSAAFLAYLITQFIQLTRSSKGPYPPGPKGFPFIGNTLDFPTTNIVQQYVLWGKKYGSNILHASAFGKHVVILNKREDADELFEGRAAIYSDRPLVPIAELLGFDYNFGFMPFGEKWRMRRKITHQLFRHDAIKDFHPLITRKVRRTLGRLLDCPEKFEDHNKWLSISIPLSAMYGYELESVYDPCITAANESMTLSVKLIAPGGSLINILPILRYVPPWFPGASSRKTAEKVRSLTRKMQAIPLGFAESQVAEGNATPSLVTELLEKKYAAGVSEEEEMAVLDVAATVYGGASDTTIAATDTFIYLMAVHPGVQRKAQVEIDSIIGMERLPTFEDRPALPYIEAIYRELLRWKPPAQAGAPHRVTEDDFYKGYFIPKGSSVFANIWAMTHDETVYPDSMTFKPERFLEDDGTLNGDDRILAYGFGKRVCVGKYMASATLWLTFVSVLATFDIGKATDEQGNDVEVDGGYEDFVIVVHKKPFKCSITARSSTAKKLIEESL